MPHDDVEPPALSTDAWEAASLRLLDQTLETEEEWDAWEAECFRLLKKLPETEAGWPGWLRLQNAYTVRLVGEAMGIQNDSKKPQTRLPYALIVECEQDRSNQSELDQHTVNHD